MGDAARNEPSMEDILSSIRRIVSQEDRAAGAKAQAAAAVEPLLHQADPSADNRLSGNLANLARRVRNEPPQTGIEVRSSPNGRTAAMPVTQSRPEPASVSAADSTIRNGNAAQSGPGARSAGESGDTSGLTMQTAVAEKETREALIKPGTEKAVIQAIERLRKSVEADLDKKVDQILRPILGDWLETNLPALVEKIVREEIERITRCD
jgi:uncharacterized protein